MISAEEATKIIQEHSIHPKAEEVDLEQARGRILREDIVADQDFPPFDRVMMDGIAIDASTLESGETEFTIEGIQTAGAPQQSLSNPQHCLEVMTGAMLPTNTNLVIPYEQFEINNNVAQVHVQNVRPYQNIHARGTDRQAGDLLIKSGTVISPAEVAVLATVGKAKVKVAERFKIAIVSTGDELVEVAASPLPHQIRKSNVYALQAALSHTGFHATCFHVADEMGALQMQLRQILDDHDVVILSGGVSKGKKDYVPQVLNDLRVKKLFHGVRQRPGKPFWFGFRDEQKPTAVFALPGNPVSTFMCFYKYVQPWINTCYEVSRAVSKAQLADDFSFMPELTYFLQVKLMETDGVCQATPVAGKGSGDLANLLEADAFLELPAGRSEFKRGELYPYYRYR